MKRRLSISFSGGKTSAYMTHRLLSEHRREWDEIIVLFANTGQEHEKTLEYVDKCDRHYGFNVVWLEAVVHPGSGNGTTHRQVTFGTASRKGEPFEEVIKKYGLPNQTFQTCTRELKDRVMMSYRRSLGWLDAPYSTAVGIRFDEMDRMSPNSMSKGVFYPLIDWRVTKQMVQDWELSQPVRLGIPEHFGNCVWCWKKSFRKLATISLEYPEAFAFPRRVEVQYPDAGAGMGGRKLFRGRRMTGDIFAMARDPNFKPFVDGFKFEDETMDQGAACGESCEVGVDGPTEVEAVA